MVIVKCKECGKEYELGKGETSSNFQCECGGNLSVKLGTIPIVTPPKNNKKEEKAKSSTDLSKPYTEGGEGPVNRKWIFIIGVLLIIVGLSAPLFILVGVLILILGIFLFFTDSWVIYLIIFLLLTFGSLFAWLYSTANYLNFFAGLVFTSVGAINLYYLAKIRKKRVKGHVS